MANRLLPQLAALVVAFFVSAANAATYDLYSAQEGAALEQRVTGLEAAETARQSSTAALEARVAALERVTLVASGSVVIGRDNQVVERLDITAADGIVCNGYSGVVISTVRIFHSGVGIRANNCPGLIVRDVEVIHSGTPALYGGMSWCLRPEDNATKRDDACNNANINVHISNSAKVLIERLRVKYGSSGLYCHTCPDLVVNGFDARNIKGVISRGQGLQLHASHRAQVSNFIVVLDPAADSSEDTFSVYRSDNVLVQTGYVSGNNSRSGQAVITEGSYGVTFRDMWVENFSNGAIASTALSGEVTDETLWDTIRIRRQHDNTASGRGAPSSGGLAITAFTGGDPVGVVRNMRVRNVAVCYAELIRNAVAYNGAYMVEKDWRNECVVFPPRSQFYFTLPWE